MHTFYNSQILLRMLTVIIEDSLRIPQNADPSHPNTHLPTFR